MELFSAPSFVSPALPWGVKGRSALLPSVAPLSRLGLAGLANMEAVLAFSDCASTVLAAHARIVH